MSRHHATITVSATGKSALLHDNNSRNGITVGEDEDQTYLPPSSNLLLRPGDIFHLGGCRVELKSIQNEQTILKVHIRVLKFNHSSLHFGGIESLLF